MYLNTVFSPFGAGRGRGVGQQETGEQRQASTEHRVRGLGLTRYSTSNTHTPHISPCHEAMAMAMAPGTGARAAPRRAPYTAKNSFVLRPNGLNLRLGG